MNAITDIADLTSIVMNAARVLIIAAGGAIGIVKIVKGKSDENPREFNEGLIILGATGVVFAATFAVQGIFTL